MMSTTGESPQNPDQYSVGPISHTDLNIIKDYAAKNMIDIEIEVDRYLMHQAEEANQKDSQQQPQHFSVLGSAKLNFNFVHQKFLFVYFNKNDAFKLKKILTRLSLEINEIRTYHNPTELLNTEDYLCPQCSYASNRPGLCCQHGIQLISYFDC